MTQYETRILNRNKTAYLIGLIARWIANLKYARARRIAKKMGGVIGEGVIMPVSFARRLNSNCRIGSHVSIQTDQIDTRSPLQIGNNVIIGKGSQILTTSHNIDSPEWETKHYGLTIEDYAWIPTNVLILPSCRKIGRGAVIGSGSVVAKDVEAMSVVAGNPAVEIKKRKCVHSDLVVESLLAGDYHIYKDVWNKRKK